MPPPLVKPTRDVIYYYYAKLVIAPSAGLTGLLTLAHFDESESEGVFTPMG
jgi:hypothetical protein